MADQAKQLEPNEQAHAGRLNLAAVSWAARKSFIQVDPLKGKVDLPTPLKRGKEAAMPKELIDLLISEARKNLMKSEEFADLLWILSETGTRPIEIRMAEACRFAKFIYLPELTQTFLAFADVQTADMLNLPRPALKGGKSTNGCLPHV